MLEAVLESADALTCDHTSARKQRIEIITRGERRRRWTPEQKREIAAESLEPGASPITVARKHGISTGQLYTWRQELLRNALGAAADTKPSFVRVDVKAGQLRLAAVVPAAPELAPAAPPAAPSPAPPADSDESGHLFQLQSGHHSNLKAAGMASSRRSVLVIS
jgi:transposase